MCFKCRKFKNNADDEVITESKLGEILAEKDEEHKKNTVIIVICIITAVLALAAIGYFIYKLVKPDYLKDYESSWLSLISLFWLTSTILMILKILRQKTKRRKRLKRNNPVS